jgi:hypothetical protein
VLALAFFLTAYSALEMYLALCPEIIGTGQTSGTMPEAAFDAWHPMLYGVLASPLASPLSASHDEPTSWEIDQANIVVASFCTIEIYEENGWGQIVKSTPKYICALRLPLTNASNHLYRAPISTAGGYLRSSRPPVQNKTLQLKVVLAVQHRPR